MRCASCLLPPAAPPSPTHTASLLFLKHPKCLPFQGSCTYYSLCLYIKFLLQILLCPQSSTQMLLCYWGLHIKTTTNGIGTCPHLPYFLFSLPSIILCFISLSLSNSLHICLFTVCFLPLGC